MAAIQDLANITGGILAGGEGRRLAGADKGLVAWRGKPLVRHVLEALKGQTRAQCISANRNIDVYACFGVPVVRDGDGEGPLAGLAALLGETETEWLLCVPCDAPLLPADLAATLLARAQAAQALASFLHDGERAHPTFCLVHRSLTVSAHQGAAQGLGLGDWLNARGAVPLPSMAPINLNTAEDFAALDAVAGTRP
jgi:molybdopterin-guanine dinucleotide biosynthesis protein A